MTYGVNPYRPGAGLMPVYLAGREQDVDSLDSIFTALTLNIPVQSVIFSGLRGVGKTVLINRLQSIAEDKGSFECTITPYDPFGNKWLEPYWRWDGSTSTGFASNVKNGGDNPKISVKAGTYIFEFDTHLLRSKLYPKE